VNFNFTHSSAVQSGITVLKAVSTKGQHSEEPTKVQRWSL